MQSCKWTAHNIPDSQDRNSRQEEVAHHGEQIFASKRPKAACLKLIENRAHICTVYVYFNSNKQMKVLATMSIWEKIPFMVICVTLWVVENV